MSDGYNEEEIEAAFGWQDSEGASSVALIAALEGVGWDQLVEQSPHLRWQLAIADADNTGSTAEIRELLRSGARLDRTNAKVLADLMELKKFGGDRDRQLRLNRTDSQQEYFRAMIAFFWLKSQGVKPAVAYGECDKKYRIGSLRDYMSSKGGGDRAQMRKDRLLARALARSLKDIPVHRP